MPRAVRPALRALWLGGEDVGAPRMLAFGALVWGAYSVVQVLVNGVVLDEVVQPAQIIAGTVHYPPGHPHQVFFPQAYSLLHYLAAGLWTVVPSVWLVSGILNVLFVFVTTLVPFAVGVVLTGRPYWGHVASVFTLSEAIISFQGVYPLWVFPTFYSHSHIALHVAVLSVLLLLAGLWRPGGFLLGLLPSIHPAMAMVVWPWSACYFLLDRGRRARRAGKRLVVSALLGAAVSAALAVVTFVQRSSVRVQYPYDARANGDLIFENFTVMSNAHTQIFSITSVAYLVNPVAFFVVGSLLLWNARQQSGKGWTHPAYRACLWPLLLGGIAWVFVYGARLYQTTLGPLPFYVSASKPFRLSNLSAVLILPITVSAIAHSLEATAAKTRVLALSLVVLLLSVEAVYLRVDRVVLSEHFVYATLGTLLALSLVARRRDRGHALVSLLALSAVGATLLLMLVTHQSRGAVSLALGFAASSALLGAGALVSGHLRLDWDRWASRATLALVAACVLVSVVGLRGLKAWDRWNSIYDPAGNRLGRWDTLSSYDLALREWLARNAQPDEMILPAIEPRSELQVKTGHPVLFELETLFLMDFIPGLAAPVGAMTRDLYGIDYADPAQLRRVAPDGALPVGGPVWLDAWKRRSRAEWQSLGRKYGFRLVLSRTDAPLDLPVALPGPLWTLYTIP